MPIVILLLIVSVLNGCKFWTATSAEEEFAKRGFTLHSSWNGFQKTEKLPSDSDSLFAFALPSGEILRVQFFENLPVDQAKSLARDRSLAIQRLFADREVPYVGKVSAAESCVSKNQINAQFVDRADGFQLEYQLRATKNFVFGACSESEDIYNTKYIIQYCQNSGTLTEAKLFRKIGEDSRSKEPLMECAQK